MERSQTELITKLSYIYNKCNSLVDSILHENYQVAGNIAIFAQSKDEFTELSRLTKELTKPSDNPNQKYFELITAITLRDLNREDQFTHLYIRKHDPSEYGRFLGDIDYITDDKNYSKLKDKVLQNKIDGATMYDRPGWDTMQITKPDFDVVAYVCTQEMAEKARIKFDDQTNL